MFRAVSCRCLHQLLSETRSFACVKTAVPRRCKQLGKSINRSSERLVFALRKIPYCYAALLALPHEQNGTSRVAQNAIDRVAQFDSGQRARFVHPEHNHLNVVLFRRRQNFLKRRACAHQDMDRMIVVASAIFVWAIIVSWSAFLAQR